jgi:hypothetical protein
LFITKSTFISLFRKKPTDVTLIVMKVHRKVADTAEMCTQGTASKIFFQEIVKFKIQNFWIDVILKMQNPGITTHHGQYEPMWKILPIKKLEK